VEHHLSLAYRPPLAWATMLRYFAARALPGVEEVRGDSYLRTTSLPGGAQGTVEVRRDGESSLAVRIVTGAPPSPGAVDEVSRRVTRLFGLATETGAADALLSEDSRLAPLVAADPGLRPPGAWDPYETGARAIIGQQVSVAGATTIAGRIAARCGEPLELDGADGRLRTLFPPPEVLAGADLERIGMPAARVAAIRGFAAAVARGEVRLERAPDEPALDDLVAAVSRLPGLGPWTAHYLALRSGYGDAFPATDLGLRRALTGAGGKPPSGREVLVRAEGWRPWRAHATVHLWLGGG
jgi:AraC family transcriptional regulator of adaptative response / DNA-3-methyladenine glycosylase II